MARVAIAMSGGVDSSVAAALLKQQGHDVIGIHMKLFRGQNDDFREKSCCSYDETVDARNTCYRLDIPFYVIDYTKEFRELVIDNFIKEYSLGLTPNPCVICNKKIKNDLLIKKIDDIGCEFLATGHYAKISNNKGVFQLVKARDFLKDQTYFLYGIKNIEINRLIFPLQNKTKKQVRDIATKLNFDTSKKPDSQEICFVKDDYRDFLKKEIKNKPKPGDFLSINGKVLGKHVGIPYYTVGQRRGIKISDETPFYVVKIDVENNSIVLGKENDLFSKSTIVSEVNWVSIPPPKEPIEVTAKIRYAHRGSLATVVPKPENRVQVIFKKPERAISPGQSAVFYRDNILLGGGKISNDLSTKFK